MARTKSGFAVEFGVAPSWDPRTGQAVAVKFSRPFFSKPEVVIGLSCFVQATNITESGFDIAAIENARTKGLTRVTANWFAFEG